MTTPTCQRCQTKPAVDGSRFCWPCMTAFLTDPQPAPEPAQTSGYKYPLPKRRTKKETTK